MRQQQQQEAAASAAAAAAAASTAEDAALPGHPGSAGSDVSGPLQSHSRTASESSDLGLLPHLSDPGQIATSGPASLAASAATSRAATPEAGSLAAAAVAVAAPATQQLQQGQGAQQRSLDVSTVTSQHTDGSSAGPASTCGGSSTSGGDSSEMGSEDQVDSLRQHLQHLQQQLCLRDDAIAGLKVRVAQLEAQLTAAGLPAPAGDLPGGGSCPRSPPAPSGAASRPSSAASQPRSSSSVGEQAGSPAKPAGAAAANGMLENGHLSGSSAAAAAKSAAAAAAVGLAQGGSRLQPGGLPANSPSGAILASATASMSAAMHQDVGGQQLRRPASQQGHASSRSQAQMPVMRQASAPAIGRAGAGGVPGVGPGSRHVPGMSGLAPTGSQFNPAVIPTPYSKTAMAGVPASKQQQQGQRLGYSAAAAAPPADANGTAASYRTAALGAANLAHAMGSLSMGANHSSSGSSAEGLPGSSLLANGSSEGMYAAAAGTGGMLQQSGRGFASPLPTAAKVSPGALVAWPLPCSANAAA